MSLETLLTLVVATAIFLAVVALRLALGGLFRLALKATGRTPAARRPARQPRSHALPRRSAPALAQGAVQRWSARTVKRIGGGIAAAGLAVARAGCSVAEAGAAYEAKLRERLDKHAGASPADSVAAASTTPHHIDLRDEDPLAIEPPPAAARSSR